MKTVVPDASVLLKWVLPGPDEADVKAAISLRDAALNEKIRLVVPSLWIFEVANILVRRMTDSAKEAIKAYIAFGLIEGVTDEKWLKISLSLVRNYGVTFYDASYHAMAIKYGGVLITADEKYLNRADATGSVKLLKEWQPD